MDYVKLNANVTMEVDTDKLAWVLSTFNEDGEIPRYVIKYIVLVAAE